MNDVDWLKQVFAPLDPARDQPDGRIEARRVPAAVVELRVAPPPAVPAQPGTAGRRRWAVPVAVAATVTLLAASVQVVVGVVSRRPADVPAAQSSGAVVPRVRYDHVTWETWVGSTLNERGQRWFDGVEGRVLVTGPDGSVLRDYQVRLPPSAGPTTKTDPPPGAPPSALPRPSIALEADEFPSVVPSDVRAMRAYLADGQADAQSVARRAGQLIFARTLSPAQTRALVAVLAELDLPGDDVVAPDRRRLRALTLTGSDRRQLLLAADGSALVGMSSIDEATTERVWRLLVAADLTASTTP